MTVATNLNHSLQLTLVTNVRLPGGNIHLELENDGESGQFALWVWNYSQNRYEKLLDTEGRSVVDLSLARWRRLVGCASEYDSPKTPIYITSSRHGSATLRFRYWGVVDGFFVQDSASQVITSVNPPSMTNSVIPLLARGAILAQGIPALAPPTGATRFLPPIMEEEANFDVNLSEVDGGIDRG